MPPPPPIKNQTCNSCSTNRWQSWLGEPLHNLILCTSCRLSWIRRTCTQVIQAWIISCLDYCNALYTGLPLKSIEKLQLVQSAVAQTIFGSRRMAHIILLFSELHWLLVCFQVQFKVLVNYL